jgi:spore germination protein (amino acid permease)
MNNQSKQLSPVQLGLFILSAQIGMGVATFPNLLAKQVGHNGWITISLTGGLASGATGIIMLLLKRYQDCSIYEINHFLLGKWLGKVVNYGLLVYLLMTTTFSIMIFSKQVQLFHLSQIPLPIITILIILPTVFLVKNGWRAIGRFSYFMIFIFSAVFIISYQLFDDFRISFLKPVEASDWVGIFSAIPTVFLGFISLGLTAFVYPAVQDRRQVMRWTIVANFLTLTFFELLYIVSTGVFGEAVLVHLESPLFSMARAIRVPIIERLDLFFFLLWFPLMEGTVRSYFAVAYDGIRQLFHLTSSNYTLAMFTSALILLSLSLGGILQISFFTNLVNFFGCGVILYLIACFGCSFVWKNGVPSK